MKKLPKTCLTCKFMDFVDDELEDLRCFHESNIKNSHDGMMVNDDDTCDFHSLNKAVQQDADQGCWE